MNSNLEDARTHGFWGFHRRPILLVSLVTGLVVFLVWLPRVPRAALFAALLAQRALMSLLFLFALIALSLVWSAGQRLDTWVFLLFNLRGYHPKLLDRFAWLATQVGNMLTAFLLAGLFFLMNYVSLAVEMIFGTLMLWLQVEIIKVLTDRARPFLALQGARIIGWKEHGRSFPSGHTAQTFFLMTLLSHYFQLGFGGTVALYAVALLVGFTRIYVGAHYPRDVIGGAVLGAVWGGVAVLVDPYWLQLRF